MSRSNVGVKTMRSPRPNALAEVHVLEVASRETPLFPSYLSRSFGRAGAFLVPGAPHWCRLTKGPPA